MTGPIALIDTYEEIVNVLRERRRSLGLSQSALDELAGLPSGKVAYIESGKRGSARNSIHLPVLTAMRQALGLKFMLVHSTGKHAPETLIPQGFQAMPAEKNELARRASLGGRKRALMLNPKRRSDIARKAAMARWRPASKAAPTSGAACP